MLEIYTDGSFKTDTSSYAGIIILNGKVIHIVQGYTKDYPEHRNVTGECYAVIKALEWCNEFGYKEVKIYHDYTGIAEWALGRWKANKPMTQEYKKFMNDIMKIIKVEFQWVKGHSKNKFNEMADQEAKRPLIELGLLKK